MWSSEWHLQSPLPGNKTPHYLHLPPCARRLNVYYKSSLSFVEGSFLLKQKEHELWLLLELEVFVITVLCVTNYFNPR